MQDHSFISITVTPVDARVGPDGAVEYAEAPERQLDHTPEQVCQICFEPMTPEIIAAECAGPKVPDDASSLT